MPAPGPPSLTPSVETVFEAPSGVPGSTMWSPTLATQAPKAAIICSRASADAGGPPPPWYGIKYGRMEPPSVWADVQNNGRPPDFGVWIGQPGSALFAQRGPVLRAV